jgi:sulfatase maturation enzyme AslB (radical SAM superfamily)
MKIFNLIIPAYKYFMNTSSSQIVNWQNQITQVTGTKTFCVLPWIHLATRPTGDMRICCVANASGAETGDYTVGLVKMPDGEPANFAKDLPSEAFNNDYMKSVRKTMLEGKVPTSCTKCFKEEEQGVASKRIWETGTWFKEGIDIPALIEATEEDGSIPYKLQYLDLRLGHTCNLKCVMCSPHDSSLWVSEHKKIYPIFTSPLIKKQLSWQSDKFNNTWHENPAFWEEIYEQIPHIKQIYFAGGEPLLIKEHRRFLEEIVARGYADKIVLRYNTNGTLISQSMIDLWSKFCKVKVGFSLDGIADRGHYIRYPLDWTTIEQNLELLDNAPTNIETTIACAVQILNIMHIPDFIKWKINKKFKRINLDDNVLGETHSGGLFSAHLVWIPTWLSLRVLPKEDKLEVRRLFGDLQEWLWKNYTIDNDFWEVNPYGWKRWEGILDWMDSEDQSHLLPDFKEYILTLDAQRGTDFKSTFPELGHLL